jgi:hypothetical protein
MHNITEIPKQQEVNAMQQVKEILTTYPDKIFSQEMTLLGFQRELEANKTKAKTIEARTEAAVEQEATLEENKTKLSNQAKRSYETKTRLDANTEYTACQTQILKLTGDIEVIRLTIERDSRYFRSAEALSKMGEA